MYVIKSNTFSTPPVCIRIVHNGHVAVTHDEKLAFRGTRFDCISLLKSLKGVLNIAHFSIVRST